MTCMTTARSRLVRLTAVGCFALAASGCAADAPPRDLGSGVVTPGWSSARPSVGAPRSGTASAMGSDPPGASGPRRGPGSGDPSGEPLSPNDYGMGVCRYFPAGTGYAVSRRALHPKISVLMISSLYLYRETRTITTVETRTVNPDGTETLVVETAD